VSTTRMSTTTLSTLNPRISLPFTRLCPQFPHTSPLLLVLVTFTVSTSQETSSCTQSSWASTKSMSRMLSEPRRTSQYSWFSTVDPVLPSRSTSMLLDTESSRSISIPICNTPTSLVSATMFSTRRTTSCSKLVTQMVRTSQTRNTLIPVSTSCHLKQK